MAQQAVNEAQKAQAEAQAALNKIATKPAFPTKPDLTKPTKPDLTKPDLTKPDLTKPTKPTKPEEEISDEAEAVGDPHLTLTSGNREDLCCKDGHCKLC